MTAFLHTAGRPFRWVHQRTLARHGRQLDAMADHGKDSHPTTESEWLSGGVMDNHRMNGGGGSV